MVGVLTMEFGKIFLLIAFQMPGATLRIESAAPLCDDSNERLYPLAISAIS